MKIGIVTFWWSMDNYGQLLQCYALQSFLREQGHDAFLICYKPTYVSSKWRWVKAFNPVKLANFFSRKMTKVHAKPVSRSAEEFRKNFINKTECVYHSYEALNEDLPQADVYICGSDQVWNYDVPPQKNVRPWFLDFGEEKAKRISYAASFGKARLSKKSLKFIKPMLARFDAISVREAEGTLICEKAGQNTAEHVLDPCMLLQKNDYLKIAYADNHDKPFVLGYFLNFQNQEDIYWNEIKDYTESLTDVDFKVVPAHGVESILSGGDFYFPTIPQWLYAYSQAEKILTSSFHGMVFAIIMHKPFLVFTLQGQSAKMNGRFTSLLNDLGLIDRIYDPNKEDVSLQMDATIDWKNVDKKLNVLRKRSIDFLLNALEK